MLLKKSACLASILFFAQCAWALPARAQTLAITGATIIDGTGRAPLADGVIVIKEGRIAAVGAAAEVKVPGSARRIDARGQFIIPGLMDANVHLMMNVDVETLVKHEGRYDEIALEAAQIALKTGQTTVFDTYGPRAALVKTRDAINSGRAPGSRIYLAGSIIGFTGPLGADMTDTAVRKFLSKAFVERINDTWEQGVGRQLLWMTPEQVRPIIREYSHKGVNFLKYGSSGHGAWPEAATFEFIGFSPRVQRVIVEEGHAAGLTVQAHATTVESLDMAIEAGVDIVTHGDITGVDTPIPQATLEKLVQRGIAVSVMPVTQRQLDAVLEDVKKAKRRLDYRKLARVNQLNMIEAGVTLLLSTDAGLANPVLSAESGKLSSTIDPTDMGEGHFNALMALEEMRMAPMEILKSATSNIARAYKVDAGIGTLEAGKIADLVILERNPLDSARNYRSIRTVIKDGKAVDRDALPAAPIISSMKTAPAGAGS